jgi:hypothetical protein
MVSTDPRTTTVESAAIKAITDAFESGGVAENAEKTDKHHATTTGDGSHDALPAAFVITAGVLLPMLYL